MIRYLKIGLFMLSSSSAFCNEGFIRGTNVILDGYYYEIGSMPEQCLKGQSNQLVAIQFTNHEILTTTPYQLFKTQDGWKYAYHLDTEDCVEHTFMVCVYVREVQRHRLPRTTVYQYKGESIYHVGSGFEVKNEKAKQK